MKFKVGDRVHRRGNENVVTVAAVLPPQHTGNQIDMVVREGSEYYLRSSAHFELAPTVFEVNKRYSFGSTGKDTYEVIAKKGNQAIGWVNGIAGWYAGDHTRDLYVELP